MASAIDHDAENHETKELNDFFESPHSIDEVRKYQLILFVCLSVCLGVFVPVFLEVCMCMSVSLHRALKGLHTYMVITSSINAYLSATCLSSVHLSTFSLIYMLDDLTDDLMLDDN